MVIDLAKPFDLEIVIRNPIPLPGVQQALQGNHGYADQADFSALRRPGDRTADTDADASSATIPAHPIRNSPMFFRDNGMNLDLVDLYRGASVFLILNGPGFAAIDHQQLLRRPGILTFGINNGAHLFRPHFWTCVDDPTRFMESIWRDPAITKFVPMGHFRKPIWDAPAGRVSAATVADFPNVAGFRRNVRVILRLTEGALRLLGCFISDG